jgi:hypothetical protein
VLGGYFQGNGTGLTRATPGLQRDPTFGDAGTMVLPMGSGSAWSLDVAADGSLLVCGDAYPPSNGYGNSGWDFVASVRKLSPSGDAQLWAQTIPFLWNGVDGVNARASLCRIDEQGLAYVVATELPSPTAPHGPTALVFGIARFFPDGGLDHGFGDGGVLEVSAPRLADGGSTALATPAFLDEHWVGLVFIPGALYVSTTYQSGIGIWRLTR